MTTFSPDSTAAKVLAALQPYDIKGGTDGQYHSNSPFRPGSNSHGFSLKIDGPESGTAKDHVTGETYSLYQVADHFGIPRLSRTPVESTHRAYKGIADYAAAHGLTADDLTAAEWEEVPYYDGRPTLRFPTAGGLRYRFLDGQSTYTSQKGFKTCWFGLKRAVEIAKRTGQRLVWCNGEISTIAAQKRGVAAFCLSGGERTQPTESMLAELKSLWDGGIDMALDCDTAGAAGSSERAKTLRGAGFNDVRELDLMLGDKGDLANFVRLHEGDSVAALAKLPERNIAIAESAAAKPRFQIVRSRDLHTMPPQTYLVSNEIPARGLTVLFGPSGVGKSFVALDYGLTIAQSGNVIYCASEGSSGYADRVAAWCNHHKQSDDNLHFVFDTLNLLSDSDINQFIEAVKPLNPRLIVIDTLARSLLGGDENSARDVGLAIEACGRLQRAMGSAVLLVHHTGKSGASERGSSALRGASDMMLELTNDDGLLTLSCSKSKDSEPFAPRYMRLVPFASRDGRTAPVTIPASKVIDSKDAPLSPNARAVLEVLTWEPFAAAGAKAAQLWKEARIPEGSIFRVLNSLMKRGCVSQNQRGDPFYITEMGRKALGSPQSTIGSTIGDSTDSSMADDTSVPTANGESTTSEFGAMTENYRGTTSTITDTIDSSTNSTTSLSHPFRGDSSDSSDSSLNGVVKMQKGMIYTYAKKAGVKFSDGITGDDLWKLFAYVPEPERDSLEEALTEQQAIRWFDALAAKGIPELARVSLQSKLDTYLDAPAQRGAK